MSVVEERMRRLEEVLRLILDKLERIERLLLAVDAESAEVIKLASKFTLLLSLPASRALDLANRAVNIFRLHGGMDEVSKAIIEALVVKDEVTISELTRLVRLVRGSASRRIVTERIRRLEKMGLVITERRGNRVLVKLRV
ncbi:MAG TPA: hypothetical protein ENF75_06900 [Acidilobales archaeon]|nr:hypothetical protein [Acidilobales archaeon]